MSKRNYQTNHPQQLLGLTLATEMLAMARQILQSSEMAFGTSFVRNKVSASCNSD
jgi:hypothetical protein